LSIYLPVTDPIITMLAPVLCGYLGQGAIAVLRAEHGLRLSPLGPHVFFHEHVLSQAHYINGNYDEAIAWARKTAQHNARAHVQPARARDQPRSPPAHRCAAPFAIRSSTGSARRDCRTDAPLAPDPSRDRGPAMAGNAGNADNR
jgi:hypothetical protein